MQQDDDADDANEIGRISLNLSSLGFIHARKVEQDSDEIKFLEKLYKKIDSLVDKDDLEGMMEVYGFIVDTRVNDMCPFEYRYKKWEEKKQKEMQECYRAFENV